MRILLARHAETVFNARGRMQGNVEHTPLTRAGIAQADAMGALVAAELDAPGNLDIWASPAGRTLQTAAVIAEHLGRDFFDINIDPRLREIEVGDWEGRFYAEVIAETGPILHPDHGVFSVRPPGGEWYPDIAERLRSWLASLSPGRDMLVISHGVTLRVLRGLLEGGEDFEGVRLGKPAPQGSVVSILKETDLPDLGPERRP